MKTSVPLLRLSGVFLLCLSASLAEAKGCLGSIQISLKYADGSTVQLTEAEVGFGYAPDLSVSLYAGDTLILHQTTSGNCYGNARIEVRGVPLGETADYSSPVVNAYSMGTSARIAQRGSYNVRQLNVDVGQSIRLFIDAPQGPLPLGLLFTSQSSYPLGSAIAGDTCSGPCLTANLYDGGFVRMQPICGGMAQEGGNVVVRYAADGVPLSFDSPADTLPLVGFEGYQFSTDGMYLLSVEGPLVTASAYAFVRVSHLIVPFINLQIAQKHSEDGSFTTTNVTAGGPVPFIHVELAPDDSIRVRYIVYYAPCTGIVLKAFRSESDTATTMDPLFFDEPIAYAGVTFRETGSFLFTLEDTCGALTASAHLTVTDAFSTGIATATEDGFHAFYANDLLLVDTKTGGLLEVRNMAGQLVRAEQVVQNARHQPIPFSGEANGVYIATLRSASKVDVLRFVVY